MPAASTPAGTRTQRLEALRALRKYSTRRRKSVSTASPVWPPGSLNVPIALVSFIGRKKAISQVPSWPGHGGNQPGTALFLRLHHSRRPTPWSYRDARLDNRFADNVLVSGKPQIRFYASAARFLDRKEARSAAFVSSIGSRGVPKRAEDLRRPCGIWRGWSRTNWPRTRVTPSPCKSSSKRSRCCAWVKNASVKSSMWPECLSGKQLRKAELLLSPNGSRKFSVAVWRR